MKFISLIDTTSQNIITIDANSHVLKVEIDEHKRECRLKPFMAEILYALFNKHPLSLSYDDITRVLKVHNLVVSDVTRMHRKLSEIRNFISSFHPSLDDLIQNIRGIGYSLPLRMKNLHSLKNDHNIQFKSSKITKQIGLIKALIDDAIIMVSKGKIIKHELGFIMNRDNLSEILADKMSSFNLAEKIILPEINLHEAEFIYIRIQYLLAKLRTYIGLSRISEYPITEAQWLDWFTQEVWLLFDELQRIIKLAEV